MLYSMVHQHELLPVFIKNLADPEISCACNVGRYASYQPKFY
jgi:hypothetical protein